MIIPQKETIKKIFRIYQNKCAFHDCDKKILGPDHSVNGNIFFIESNKKGHPRFNPKLTNEQMTDYSNLIMFCDIHGWEVEWKKEQYTALGLQKKVSEDSKNQPPNYFELSDEMYEDFLHNFIDYHDPDRFSHIEVLSALHDDGAAGNFYVDISCGSQYIKPTKHLPGGKFEIIDTRGKIQEHDIVVFTPKNSRYKDGVQANIEVKSQMRIEGQVPNIPKGEYYVALKSSISDKSKFDDDLSFTVL